MKRPVLKEKVRPIRERDIETAVVMWAKANGILAVKLSSMSQRSLPDRMFLLPNGRTVFIEFKVPGNKPTLPQRRMMERIEELGHEVTWADNHTQAIAWLDERMREQGDKGE